jgi:hypothetical protein
VIDHITTPDVDPGMVLGSVPNLSEPTINSVYFGFIGMEQPKCMLNTRGSESIKYCTFVNTIFSVLGFTYALLIVLNNEIPITSNLNLTQVVSIRAANFGGYIFGHLLGLWVLRCNGFKATFVTGLGIYCIGTLMF